MTLQQQIWRSTDADLIRDLAKYRQAIEDNQMPDMIDHWRETEAMIERELDQRQFMAATATSQMLNQPLTEVPF